MNRYDIGASEDIPVGRFQAVKAGEQNLLVFHLEDGFYATQAHCTHVFAPLKGGKLVEEHQIRCPLHHARFDVRTGEVVEWACHPPGIIKAINAVRKEKALKTFPVSEEDGRLFVVVA